jgi:uncharacterized protein (DUF1499 family)
MSGRWWPRNWAETSAPGDPSPLELPLSLATATARLTQVVAQLPRWRVESSDTGLSTLHATRRTKLFGFIDDVRIRLEAVNDTLTRIHVRSQSRVGLGDFGENRRNILELFAALSKEPTS